MLQVALAGHSKRLTAGKVGGFGGDNEVNGRESGSKATRGKNQKCSYGELPRHMYTLGERSQEMDFIPRPFKIRET